MTRIVIVGGGPAGINLAIALANQLKPADNVEVVVLEKNSHYFWAIGTPRALVEPSFGDKLFIPYDKAIPEAAKSFVKIVQAIVTSIQPNEVEYRSVGKDESLQRLSFDYLVLATGSTYTEPINQAPTDLDGSLTKKQFAEAHRHIESANSILIIGGGSVGVEVAGEIKSKYPEKKVTILNAKDELVADNRLRDKFRTSVVASVKALGIEVVLGERLETRLTQNNFSKQTLRTDKGTVIESDIQLVCAGFSPVAGLISSLDATLITSSGSVKVNDKFQLTDARYQHIFAIGDVSDHPTPKMAYWAGEQAKHLATELVAVVRGTQSSVAKDFPAVGTMAMILPIGPNGGVSQLPLFGGLVLGDWTTRMIKSKDYMIGRGWAALGLTAPN